LHDKAFSDLQLQLAGVEAGRIQGADNGFQPAWARFLCPRGIYRVDVAAGFGDFEFLFISFCTFLELLVVGILRNLHADQYLDMMRI
jgi:hypothetical protein